MSLATRNVEPIPGYTLRERLGSGGYGEVWKADAPGGLAKAIKLVYGYADGDRASRELKAMALIKTLRHPFLLSLERIEIIDGQLIIVTELADCSLKERFEKRRAEGLRGIPRPELLQFLSDAADALDYMNEQHSLQHLDVKPENLLLVGDHVKVADFGLVKDVQRQTASMLGGLTPVYASPELFSGAASRRSDQYSLAIVYQEMLTGVLPFPGKTAAQLAAQHLNAKPLLFALPPGERKVIARALAKEPAQRFANCRELLEHLRNETLQAALPAAESWFGKGGPAREDNEPVTSTVCLSTSDPVPELGVAAETGASAHAAPYSAADEGLRTSQDMLDEAEEASVQIDTEFSPTFVMRRSREPKLEHVDAPEPATDQALRPTLIIGIGNVAGMVMQRMKQRLVDRLGKAAACPAVQFLFLDADSQGVQRAARGDDGAPLDPQEVMLLGLRKSQDYRSEGPSLLQWLSRRWLYNIPRSQTPEGLRPLGRLALADHARTVRERLRKLLQSVQSPDARKASEQASGLTFGGQPRVIVLGAICGGTAGGMMLDVCFLARQMLERLGNPARDVTGMMLHYRGRQPAAHELAVVNTYATLAELDYYCRPEKAYPGDPSCGLEPRKEDQSPVKEGYFVHLGDFLTDADLLSAADRVAEYLYLDCLSSVAGFFSACQQASPSQGDQGLKLRNFGLTQIGFSAGELIPWSAMSLCSDLFHGWIGDLQRNRAELEATAEQETDAFLQSHGLAPDQLQQTLLTEIGRALGEMPDTLFKSVLLPDGKPLTPQTLPQLDFNVVLHRLNEQLAQRSDEGIGPEAKYPLQIQALVKFVEGFVKKQAADISQWVLNSSNPPGQRLIRAEKAAAAVTKRLSALHDDSREQRRQLQDSLAKFEQLLGVGQMPAGGKLPPIRKSPQEYEAHFLEYCRLRMFNVALFFLQDLARRMKNLLTPMNDQLGDARRDLKGLISTMTPAELAESAGNELDEQLRQALLGEFAKHRATLMQELDQWLQDTLFQKGGGFLTTLGKGGDHRTQFVSQLFHAARSSVLRSLHGLDVANFLMQSSADGASIRLAGSLETARPKPLADGTCRTLIAVSQSSTNPQCRELLVSAVQEQSGVKPAVVGYGESDVTIVSELAGLPIAEVAVRLIDERADFIDYAKRVFSRGDIPFEPLTLKEEKEEVVESV
jgi:serine/threonine protein kinase